MGESFALCAASGPVSSRASVPRHRLVHGINGGPRRGGVRRIGLDHDLRRLAADQLARHVRGDGEDELHLAPLEKVIRPPLPSRAPP